jgi:hypothetical protein
MTPVSESGRGAAACFANEPHAAADIRGVVRWGQFARFKVAGKVH